MNSASIFAILILSLVSPSIANRIQCDANMNPAMINGAVKRDPQVAKADDIATTTTSNTATSSAGTPIPLPSVLPISDMYFGEIRTGYNGLAYVNASYSDIIAPRFAVIVLAEMMGGWTETNSSDKSLTAYIPCYSFEDFDDIILNVNGIDYVFPPEDYFVRIDEETCILRIIGIGSFDYYNPSWTLGQLFIGKYLSG